MAAIAYLHSDDLLATDSIEKRISALSDGLVYSDQAVFNDKLQVVGIQKGREGIIVSDFINSSNSFIFPNHTVMWQYKFLHYLLDFVKRKYDQKCLFDPRIFYGEDTEASISSFEATAERNFKVKYVPKVTSFYRVHSASITGDSKLKPLFEQQTREIFQKHFGIAETENKDYLGRLLSNPPWSKMKNPELVCELEETLKRASM